MRRASLSVAIALIAPVAAMAAPAGRPEAEPYVVDVEVVRDGRTAAAIIEVSPGASGTAVTERSIPYPAAVASADPDDVPGIASVVVGNSFRVAPVERADGMSVSADIRLSKLSGMHRVEASGRSVDLPDVETVDLAVRDEAMRREGSAWILERDDAKTGARVRIVARR